LLLLGYQLESNLIVNFAHTGAQYASDGASTNLSSVTERLPELTGTPGSTNLATGYNPDSGVGPVSSANNPDFTGENQGYVNSQRNPSLTAQDYNAKGVNISEKIKDLYEQLYKQEDNSKCAAYALQKANSQELKAVHLKRLVDCNNHVDGINIEITKLKTSLH
jgi:hypothetical protein